MKKSLITIAGFVLLLIFTSAYRSDAFDAKKGSLAPSFEVSNDDTLVSLQNLKGKFVLLSFWSSADADSRISNIQYDAVARKNNSKLALVAVNYDRNEPIYREIIKRDKLQKNYQFFDQDGLKSKIFERYHLDQGFKSYLINPAGEIIAENPSTSQLADLLSQ